MKKYILLIFIMMIVPFQAYAQVGINTTSPNSKSALDIVSKDKNTGTLLTRLTTAQRNAITGLAATEDGLTIYNTDEKCYNYYQATNATWLSLCGTYKPAVYTVDCSKIKVFGTYTQGTSLNVNNYITMPVTVATAGTYHIIAKTTNGYYFEKTGVFPNAGTFTISLSGSGAPSAGPQTDTISFEYDGTIDTSCTSVTVAVSGSQISYGITCGSAVVNGTYNAQTVLDYNTNTVTIPLSNVDTGGQVTIISSSNNGVNFTDTETITTGSTSITLHGSGTPTSAGVFTYTFTTNGANSQTCTFSVTFDTTKGTFADPADRCLDIYNLGKRTDGEYWIKTGSADVTPIKTYCDMTHGGYTLLWSYSEKTAYTGGGLYGTANSMYIGANSGAVALSANSPQNVVTTAAGVMNYTNYRIPLTAMQNSKSATLGDYRVQITNNPTNMNDSWGNGNFFNAKPTTGYDYIANVASTCEHPIVPTTGKIFGYVYDARTNNATYNNVATAGRVCPYINSGYTSHWDAGGRIAGTITAPDGTSINASSFNNLFGFFGEVEGNHLFGKCTTDDNSFATQTCSYTSLRPHSFNSGEGRYLQWFVK
ncbi:MULTISPECIES: fibrinogen-like YCDxxxxGGGW domain-containing protein [Chryseobacterium]|uniref:HYR domain-containing protein n=1 Tax=Chryseobacterium candidae TaxID=1978493 RepID=A0ABY2R7B1_9FLAO|nr:MULTISPECIES: fibrinogen-like YCDxxxxGGGW domain-containing protein [Chryseobacterium]THV60474.1 hypothetical protein EK417_09760 [Chryseobacterium candidae]